MMVCPKGCRNASLADRFCRICGEEMVKGELKPAVVLSCPECEARISPIDKFCGLCGSACHRFLFVFRHPEIVACVVFADEEEKAWLALGRRFLNEFWGQDQLLRSAKREFSLVARLEF